MKKGEYKFIGINNFYDWFIKRRIHYEEVEINEKFYKQILDRYFKIYFTELYFQNKPKYYFLSGMIEKMILKPKYSVQHKKLLNNNIGFIWYKRPSVSYFTNIRMIKLNKKAWPLRLIELDFRKYGNWKGIKGLSQLHKELVESKQTFYYD